jgi:hypothetical protein
MFTENILCSECFKDYGLAIQARLIGEKSDVACSNCNACDGYHLDSNGITLLSKAFFINGTTHRTEYGKTSLVMFNKNQKNSIVVSNALQHDIDLISEKTGIGFFYYAPPLWMVGEISPLNQLLSEEAETKNKIIKQIIETYPKITLDSSNIFYKLRKNPKYPNSHNEYDSSPNPESGRIGSEKLPILYSSYNLETCIHECRVTALDDLYFATLAPQKALYMLDLSILLAEARNVSTFESLDMAIQMLFLSGEHSYCITQNIASQACSAGFDGIIYPSFYNQLIPETDPLQTSFGLSNRKFPGMKDYFDKIVIKNIAIFGKPIQEGKVTINNINRLVLRWIPYQYDLGPACICDSNGDIF